MTSVALSEPIESSHPRLIKSLNEIAECYDHFIFDLWGVIHNGRTLYPHVLDTLDRLKKIGKQILFLSNAPRRASMSRDNLARMGVSPALYDQIYTSGEATHHAFATRPNAWYQKLGEKFYHIGDLPLHAAIYEGLPYQRVDDLKEADFILTSAALHPTMDYYESLLKEGLDRQLPMVCANPDKIVILGTEIILCCGSIAAAYESAGGDVFYHGKPFKETYETVHNLLGNPDPSRILVMGDSLATDIRGAHNAGWDSVLVMGGIHHPQLLKDARFPYPDVANRLLELVQKNQEVYSSPTYLLSYVM